VKSEPAITVTEVTVEREGFRALFNVSFHIGAGNLVGVVGPNGAGKSTLFDAIVGVLPLARGTVEIKGIDDRPGGIAYVPQRNNINMRFPATVHDVVLMGRYCHVGLFRGVSRKDREIVRACLERVGLWERRDALIEENSGGQRQRVFIARALAQEASIVLLDEAFSGVDVGAQEGIIRVLQTMRDEGKIVMLATHDLTNLAERFDQIVCVNRHICAYGPPAQVFTPEVLEELYGSHGLALAHTHADGNTHIDSHMPND
jgi:ABC-type Mn2+/Zn2+ transport system ATPase subunit